MRRSTRPKFAIARAAVPIFSPSCGSTRTIAGESGVGGLGVRMVGNRVRWCRRGMARPAPWSSRRAREMPLQPPVRCDVLVMSPPRAEDRMAKQELADRVRIRLTGLPFSEQKMFGGDLLHAQRQHAGRRLAARADGSGRQGGGPGSARQAATPGRCSKAPGRCRATSSSTVRASRATRT